MGLMQVIENSQNTDLKLVNNTLKCHGKVTRMNTKDKSEYSAIDFILATANVEKWISKMLIDEDGLYKLTGKNETDHNTICVELNIWNIAKIKKIKHVGWNIRAPPEKWEISKQELEKRCSTAKQIITDESLPLQDRYDKWCKQIDNAARESIG